MNTTKNYYKRAPSGEAYRDAWIKGSIYRQVVSGKEESVKKGWGIAKERVAKFPEYQVRYVRIFDTDDRTVYACGAQLYLDELRDNPELPVLFVNKKAFEQHLHVIKPEHKRKQKTYEQFVFENLKRLFGSRYSDEQLRQAIERARADKVGSYLYTDTGVMLKYLENETSTTQQSQTV